MTKPWHRSDPAYFEKEKREAEHEYPGLRFHLRGELVVLEGDFPLVAEGEVRDRYSVEITLARDHPKSLPIVREVAGRIPRQADRHMNNRDGTACVLLPDERWKSWPMGAPLVDFLNGPLRNFFICQSLVEQGDPWPMEQLGHGAEGIRAFYRELLGTDDDVIRSFLVCLAAKPVKGHWWCPCDSGKRLRDCHLARVVELRTKISPADASGSLRYLRGKAP